VTWERVEDCSPFSREAEEGGDVSARVDWEDGGEISKTVETDD